jgi:uncharacterized membrane protein YsdA (DUF1294 family)
LPRCITSSAPVSDTGGPGAKPGEAANFFRRIYTPIHGRNAKTFLPLRITDSFAAIWLAVFNAMTFIAFGFDKWQASGSKRRISESSLALLGALGGWPGGLLGMNVFRHKTAKLSFKLKYALTLIPFVAEVWAWLHWR